MPLRLTYPETVDPVAVLAALEIEAPGAALPLRVACPLCDGRLHLYEDTTRRAPWHHCYGCGTTGSLVDLAAAVWRLSPAAALRKLAGLAVISPDKLDERVTEYETAAAARARFAAFWREAQATLLANRSPTLAALRTRLRLHHSLPPKRWLAGPGLLVGATHIKHLGAAFDHNDRRLYRQRLLRGTGWGDLLVFPYENVPGRFTGFLLVGRGGGPDDRGFQQCWPTGGHHGETGLCGLSAVAASRLPFGPHVFAVDDPVLAARLQLRHAAIATTPLPIVSWCDRGASLTRDAWPVLDHKVPVFWGFKWTAGLLHQAVVANGLVVITELADAGPDGVDHFLRNDVPGNMLEKLVRRARPWADALDKWAKTAPYAAVEDLVLTASRYRITERLTSASDVVARIVSVPQLRAVRFNGKTIVERDDQWWCGDTRVTNATLRIRKITQIPNGNLYALTLTYQGRRHEFDLPLSQARSSAVLPAQLSSVLLREHGVAFETMRPWGSRLLRLASLFETPDHAQEGP